MVRIAQAGLLPKLVETGLSLFIRRGYRRTRIADAAKAVGIAPGTVYLYVSGKEALFELALRVAFDEPGALDVETPYTPETGDWVERIWGSFMQRDPLTRLRVAADRAPAEDPPGEWELLLRDLWAWMSRYGRAIALIESCAIDWPELGLLFHGQFRSQAFDLLARYIAARQSYGSFTPAVDPHVAARAVVEVMAWFTLHKHTDPDPSDVDGRNIEATLVTMLNLRVR